MAAESVCSICTRPPAFYIRHCRKCQTMQCADEACHDLQDRICNGDHVHENGYCWQCCGDLMEVDCPGETAVS